MKGRRKMRSGVWICLIAVLWGLIHLPHAEGWDREAFFGLNLARGNSDALSGNLKVEARKGADADIGLSASYGKTEGEKNLDRSSFSARWRRRFESDVYAGAALRAERDSVAGVDYRYVLSPVIGRSFIRSGQASLNLEAGPAFLAERVSDEKDSGLALRFFEIYERSLTENSRLRQSFEYTVSSADDYLLVFEIGAVSALTSSMSLRAALELNYDSSPAEDRKKYDLVFVTSLGFGF